MNTAASPRASALIVGDVRHRRRRPATNAFRYRTYHALLDVDELPELDRDLPGFGYNRPAPVGFRDRDHLGPVDRPVRDKLGGWLADRGVTLPDGPVRVLTNLRVLGHVFDPVSWWFCHDRDGDLVFVVAEVHNTFGEAHAYLLDDLEHAADGTVRARADKAFHVSPFLPTDGLIYRFAFALRDDAVTAHVDVDDVDGKLVDATQRGRRVELSGRTLARTLVTHPFMTLHTVLWIHVQALRLWRKRVPVVRRPEPPDDGFERASVSTGGPGRAHAARRQETSS